MKLPLLSVVMGWGLPCGIGEVGVSLSVFL